MMQRKVQEAPLIDVTPRGIADLLDGLVQVLLEDDREVAQVLCVARDSLRAIGWNRYAHLMTRKSRANTMRRRHQGQHIGLQVVHHA